jgi:hypothetical protein
MGNLIAVFFVLVAVVLVMLVATFKGDVDDTRDL